MRAVMFFVDHSAAPTSVFSVDHAAPFVVPRHGRDGKHPYALGAHVLRADVELRSGRQIRLRVTYRVARSLDVPSNIDGATLQDALASTAAGPVLVRPAAGRRSFSVSGDLKLTRSNVVIDRAVAGNLTLAAENLTIQQSVLRDVTVGDSGSGFVVEDSQVHSFYIDGADNWIIRRDIVDFKGVTYTGYNGGSIMYNAKNWKILDSTFRGAYVIANPSQHTEAWYIGAGNDGGLIQGNTFDDNGTTAQLFFTWWGSDPGVNDPRTSASPTIGSRGRTTHGGTSTCGPNSTGPPTISTSTRRPTRTTARARTAGSPGSRSPCDPASRCEIARSTDTTRLTEASSPHRDGLLCVNVLSHPRISAARTARYCLTHIAKHETDR